eukprot:3290539-Rhodomonas_salina.1
MQVRGQRGTMWVRVERVLDTRKDETQLWKEDDFFSTLHHSPKMDVTMAQNPQTLRRSQLKPVSSQFEEVGLLRAVIAVRVGAATVAVVDIAERRVVKLAPRNNMSAPRSSHALSMTLNNSFDPSFNLLTLSLLSNREPLSTRRSSANSCTRAQEGNLRRPRRGRSPGRRTRQHRSRCTRCRCLERKNQHLIKLAHIGRAELTVDPRLSLEAVGASIAHVSARGGDDLGNNLGSLEKGEHLRKEYRQNQVVEGIQVQKQGETEPNATRPTSHKLAALGEQTIETTHIVPPQQHPEKTTTINPHEPPEKRQSPKQTQRAAERRITFQCGGERRSR